MFINLTFAACLYSQLIDSRRNCEELTFNQQDDRPTMMPGTLIESVQRGDNTADVKSILPDWFPPLSIVRRHVFPQFHIVNKQYIYIVVKYKNFKLNQACLQNAGLSNPPSDYLFPMLPRPSSLSIPLLVGVSLPR